MPLKSIVRILTLSAILSLLAGCAAQQSLKPVVNPAKTWQSYKAKLYYLNNWQASGVIGIRDGNQAISANFNWQQTGNDYEIQLSGPLNIGERILQGSPGKISLTDGAQVLQADNPEDLMQQQLGWSMPVEGLVYWIRGLPVPGALYQSQLNNTGTIGLLGQQNWIIHYPLYTVVKDLPLPHKLVMTQGPWKIVIVINQWKF